ncbi:MAG TPA: SRPBCC domain-containing protein [Chitinophaga sp.]|nr:SRPBCC domain-containing protein [Chitinophaga sp.]
MPDIRHKLLIEVPVEKVYDAITTQEGLAGWWTPDTKAEAKQGSIARFQFGSTDFLEMEVDELVPNKWVKWRCTGGAEEWIGSTISFELLPHDKGTILFFHHDGWKDYTTEFATCSYHWALFLRSMKFLCETGKGFPYPDHEK